MLGVCSVACPIRFRPMLACLVLLLLPVGLAGQEGQVTLYTPEGAQPRTLSVPMVVDVGLPSPMEAPASVVVGTGTGTRRTDVEIVVSDRAGGHTTVGYADGWISSLAADASGNVWVGTTAGLSRFDGQQWTTFTTEDGLADDAIYSLAVDGKGRVWAGSLHYWKGFSRFDGQRWTRYQFEGLLRGVVAIAPNGDVWCDGYGDVLLARFDGQDWWTYNHTDIGTIESEEHFDTAYPINIAVDQSGTLWAVVYFAKAQRSAKKTDGSIPEIWTRLLTFNGTQWSAYQLGVGKIFPDSKGRVWMDCFEGLCVKDGSMWKHYDLINSAGQMTEDAAGRLWIAKGGYFGYFGVLEGTTWTGSLWKEFRVFRTPVIDSRGDLWIPTDNGLYRWHQSDLPTAIESSAMPSKPRSFHLEQNYPNPFNQTTHIGFTLQQLSAVSLQVFNTHGQLVATLVEGIRPAGTYQAAWDGRDAQGQAVSSGTYIVRLDAAGQQATRKMLLVQ